MFPVRGHEATTVWQVSGHHLIVPSGEFLENLWCCCHVIPRTDQSVADRSHGWAVFHEHSHLRIAESFLRTASIQRFSKAAKHLAGSGDLSGVLITPRSVLGTRSEKRIELRAKALPETHEPVLDVPLLPQLGFTELICEVAVDDRAFVEGCFDVYLTPVEPAVAPSVGGTQYP